MISPSRKHHYIPRFYLKRWVNSTGSLFEISRRFNALVARPTSPKGTGYVIDLNTIQTLPPDERNVLEQRFFEPADNLAAKALNILEKEGFKGLRTPALVSAVSRLILGFIYRNPETMREVRDQHTSGMLKVYERVKVEFETSPERFDETYEASFARMKAEHADDRSLAMLLQKLVDSEEIGGRLNKMLWATIELPEQSDRSFLTSDRPVISSAGWAYPNSYVALPISPKLMICGTNTEKTMKNITDRDGNTIVYAVNDTVVRQAKRFVYSSDDALLPFVDARLRASNR